MKTKNILVLGNCAGLFHWSNSNYYWGSAEYKERKAKYYNALRPLHGGDEVTKENRTFEYVINDEGKPTINYHGLELVCNDRMIEHIEGDFVRCDVINGRNFADFTEFADTKNWRVNIWKDKDCALWHNSFNSLYLDCFSKGLLYYRLGFKHDKVEFICSNGKLYLVGDEYKEIDINYLFDRLGMTSKKAKSEVSKLIEFINK